MWTPEERRFFRSLNTPAKVQSYLDELSYNPSDEALSPRYVMLAQNGHCFEGCLFAAAAMEFQNYPPLVVDLQGHNDDDHVIYVYKGPLGWGSISKSNTSLLGGREAFFESIRELVMSYFTFYFNVAGNMSLYAYSKPINLNFYNSWNWRTSEENLEDLGRLLNDHTHYELMDPSKLKKLPKASLRLQKACFLGADPSGLYQV